MVTSLCFQGCGFPSSTANTTQFLTVAGDIKINTVETKVQIVNRSAGRIKNMFIYINTNTVNLSTTINLRKNAANATQTVSIPSTATGIFEDTVNTDAIAVGDKINLQSIPGTGSTGTYEMDEVSFLYDATNNTVTRLCCSNDIIFSTASQTTFQSLQGNISTTSTTEVNQQCIQEQAGSFTNLGVNIATNSDTNAVTVRLRKNAANGNNTVSIAAAATGFIEDTTPHTDTVVAGDKVNSTIVTGLSTVNIAFESIAYDFISTAGYTQCIAANSGADTIALSTTKDHGLGGSLVNLVGNAPRVKTRGNFIFSLMSANIVSNTVSATTTIRFIQNSSNANQVLSIGSNASGFFTDSTNKDTTIPTDTVNYETITGGTGTSIVIGVISVWALFVAPITSTNAQINTALGQLDSSDLQNSQASLMFLGGTMSNFGGV
jgi:hypothetical protein